MWINWTNNKQGVKVTHTHNLYNYIKILSKTKFVFCHTSYLPLTHLVIVTRSLGSGFKRAQLWSKRRDGPFPKTTKKTSQRRHQSIAVTVREDPHLDLSLATCAPHRPESPRGSTNPRWIIRRGRDGKTRVFRRSMP